MGASSSLPVTQTLSPPPPSLPCEESSSVATSSSPTSGRAAASSPPISGSLPLSGISSGESPPCIPSPSRRRRPSRTPPRRSSSRSLSRSGSEADHRRAEVHSQPATKMDATTTDPPAPSTAGATATAAPPKPSTSSEAASSRQRRRSATIPRLAKEQEDGGRRSSSKGRSRSAPRRGGSSSSSSPRLDDVPPKSILKKHRKQSPAKTIMSAVSNVGFALGSAGSIGSSSSKASGGSICSKTSCDSSHNKGGNNCEKQQSLATQGNARFGWILCCQRRRRKVKETRKHITFKPTMRVVEFQRRLGSDAVPQDGTKLALGLGRRLRAYVAPLGNPTREAAAAMIEDHCYIPVCERLKKLRRSMGQIQLGATILRHNQQNSKLLARRRAAREDVETKLYEYMPISLYDARSRARLIQREANRPDVHSTKDG